MTYTISRNISAELLAQDDYPTPADLVRHIVTELLEAVPVYDHFTVRPEYSDSDGSVRIVFKASQYAVPQQ